jgi:hypothetical protein
MDSSSTSRVSYSLNDYFYFARLTSLANTISDLRGYQITYTTPTFEMECSSMRAQSSTVVYLNLRSVISRKLVLYTLTFGASPTSSLSLVHRKYYQSFGAFGSGLIWSLIKKTASGNMEMYFSGSDVMPLFAK